MNAPEFVIAREVADVLVFCLEDGQGPLEDRDDDGDVARDDDGVVLSLREAFDPLEVGTVEAVDLNRDRGPCVTVTTTLAIDGA